MRTGKTPAKTFVILFSLFLVIGLVFHITVLSNVVEWDSNNGGGGKATGGGNTLQGTVGQVVIGNSANGSNLARHGFRIAIPQRPAVACVSGGAACVPVDECYGPPDMPFVIQNAAGCTAPPCAFDKGATQYYRYLLQTSDAYTNAAIQAGTSWGDLDLLCPGGTCGYQPAGPSINLTPASTDDNWYFIARSYNGGLIGGDETIGPFKYDMTPPVITGTVTIANVNYADKYVDNPFDISVDGITDAGCAGLASCQYCSTTDGACDSESEWLPAVLADGVCTITGVACNNGDPLTINMRAKDERDNTTNAVAVNRICDDAPPIVTSGVEPAADSCTNDTFLHSGDTVCEDPYSGVFPGSGLNDAGAYDVQWCASGDASRADCAPEGGGTWSDTYATGWTPINYEELIGQTGKWYRFRAKCRDNVLNASSPAYSDGSIRVDTAAPTACRFVVPTDGALANKTEQDVLVQAADDSWITGVKFYYDGQYVADALPKGNGQYRLDWNIANFPEHVSKQIKAVCSDCAGNVSQDVISVNLNNTGAPAVSVLSPLDGSIVNTTFTVTMKYEDLKSSGNTWGARLLSVDKYEWYRDGKVVSSVVLHEHAGVTTLTVTLPPGEYMLVGEAYHGNVIADHVGITAPLHVIVQSGAQPLSVDAYNYPDPFRAPAGTKVYAVLNNHAAVSAKVYIGATLVKDLGTLANPGDGLVYEAFWDGKNAQNLKAPPGAYSIKVTAVAGGETVEKSIPVVAE